MKKKYTVHGPCQDGTGFIEAFYQVIGPKGGVKSEWYTRRAATLEARKLNENH